jgi:preprotein translocase subunit SecB
MHRGELRVTGWLTWISEEVATRDDARRLLLVNGLSMLFGIARVRVADLTAGSDRRLVLPSISFKPIVEDFLEEDRNSGADASDGES